MPLRPSTGVSHWASIQVGVYAEKGYTLSALARFEEAISSLDTALARDPQDLRALLAKGEALFRAGQYHDAVTAFDSSLVLGPENGRAHRGRGMALARLSGTRMRSSLLIVLEEDNSSPDLLACKGYSLYRLTGTRRQSSLSANP